MNSLSATETLYLEELNNLFKSITGCCNFAYETAIDPGFKKYLQITSKKYIEWIRSTEVILINDKLH